MRSSLRALLTWVVVFSAPAFSAPVTVQSVLPNSGKALCSALTPEDFTKAGIPVSSLREANLDGNDSAYCVYQSKAGKVEFDLFFPAGETGADISQTEKTVLKEVGGNPDAVYVPGGFDAHISLSSPGLPDSSSLVVLRDKAVFNIVIPKGPNARQQLIDLAQVALSRLKQ
jgi:hypothetical protein